MMTARRHSPLHNNEPELIDYFVSPLGSANQSALPEWNSNEAECLRATCESRCRLFCGLGILNIVINPADVPTSGKEHANKNGCLDSRKLARKLENGSLEGIYIPQKTIWYFGI